MAFESANKTNFKQTKRFFRLLFSNSIHLAESDPNFITADDMKTWIFTRTWDLNYTFYGPKKNSFLCFYLNVMYFIAYKAQEYEDVVAFVNMHCIRV